MMLKIERSIAWFKSSCVGMGAGETWPSSFASLLTCI